MNYPIQDTLDHARFLARQFHKCDAQYVILITLLELDVPTNYDGFDYLSRAIAFYYEDPAQMITKGLYAVVADAYGGSVGDSQIESSIRSAIKSAWKKKDDTVWSLYFPFDKDGKIKRPSNTEFISRIARVLQLWRGCCQAYERSREEVEVTI